MYVDEQWSFRVLSKKIFLNNIEEHDEALNIIYKDFDLKRRFLGRRLLTYIGCYCIPYFHGERCANISSFKEVIIEDC